MSDMLGLTVGRGEGGCGWREALGCLKKSQLTCFCQLLATAHAHFPHLGPEEPAARDLCRQQKRADFLLTMQLSL